MALFALLLLLPAGCAPKGPEHGTAFLLAVDTSQWSDDAAKAEAVGRAVAALRQRVARLGVPGEVRRQEPSLIRLRVGAVTGAAPTNLAAYFTRRGALEFRLVHPQSDVLVQSNTVPEGYVLMRSERTMPDGRKVTASHLVDQKPASELTGRFIKQATTWDNNLTGRPAIAFTLNAEGTRLFAEITGQNVGRQLAIVLDGVLCSAPVIRSVIAGGQGMIEGDFSAQEAAELAAVLASSLDTTLRVVEERPF